MVNEILVQQIAEAVKNEGGRALLVGGYVRDRLMGIESKDIDLEVYGLEQEKLKQILEKFDEVNEVGKSFGVFKLKNHNIEVSIPRQDSKVGEGHKDFDVKTDSEMSIEVATRRRDLTINAILMDPWTDEIIDPFNGQEAIKNKILRAVDEKTFGEDPLRVLRLGQFAARFNFQVEEKTLEIARRVDTTNLSKERVTEEFRKLLLKSEKPSVGLKVLDQVGAVEKLFPELFTLQNVNQEPDWHPEGNVWNHSLLAVDESVSIIKNCGRDFLEDSSLFVTKFEQLLKDEEEKLTIILASLAHDFGKATTTQKRLKKGQWRLTAYNHEAAGVEIVQNFLNRFIFSSEIKEKVVKLISNHMFLTINQTLTDKAVLKLADRIDPANILELILVGAADRKGRDLKWNGYPDGVALLEKADQLGVLENKPVSLISGQDLIDLGYTEGEEIGKTLHRVQEEYFKNPHLTRKDVLEKLNKEKALRN